MSADSSKAVSTSKRKAVPSDVLLLGQLKRIADALEILAGLGQTMATRAGVNIHPQGADIDESFVGEFIEMDEEELKEYRATGAPPSPAKSD